MIVDQADIAKPFVTVWHCEPPEWLEEFRTTHELWTDIDGDEPQWHIWAWDPR